MWVICPRARDYRYDTPFRYIDNRPLAVLPWQEPGSPVPQPHVPDRCVNRRRTMRGTNCRSGTTCHGQADTLRVLRSETLHVRRKARNASLLVVSVGHRTYRENVPASVATSPGIVGSSRAAAERRTSLEVIVRLCLHSAMDYGSSASDSITGVCGYRSRCAQWRYHRTPSTRGDGPQHTAHSTRHRPVRDAHASQYQVAHRTSWPLLRLWPAHSSGSLLWWHRRVFKRLPMRRDNVSRHALADEELQRFARPPQMAAGFTPAPPRLCICRMASSMRTAMARRSP